MSMVKTKSSARIDAEDEKSSEWSALPKEV
jgi:hypothetical protein